MCGSPVDIPLFSINLYLKSFQSHSCSEWKNNIYTSPYFGFVWMLCCEERRGMLWLKWHCQLQSFTKFIFVCLCIPCVNCFFRDGSNPIQKCTHPPRSEHNTFSAPLVVVSGAVRCIMAPHLRWIFINICLAHLENLGNRRNLESSPVFVIFLYTSAISPQRHCFQRALSSN